MQKELYFHSPFSEKTDYTPRNRSLLLSFALSEIFNCMEFPSHTWSFSTDLEAHKAPLDRLKEHTRLLFVAFPEHFSKVLEFSEQLGYYGNLSRKNTTPCPTKNLSKLISLLTPLLRDCAQDEVFLFFLLNHQKELTDLFDSSYLRNFFQDQEEIFTTQTFLCDYFRKKGFSSLIPRVTGLFQTFQNESIFNEPHSC